MKPIRTLSKSSLSLINFPLGFLIAKDLDRQLIKYLQELDQTHPELGIQRFSSLHHYFDENIFKYIKVAIYSRGKVFGELGILNKKLRAATITCLEDCYFGILTAEDYKNILLERENRKINKKTKFISQTIGNQISDELLSKFCYTFKRRQFNIGETLF